MIASVQILYTRTLCEEVEFCPSLVTAQISALPPSISSPADSGRKKDACQVIHRCTFGHIEKSTTGMM